MEQSLNQISCFILAAGLSKRMGLENKLLKKYNNNIIINQTLKSHYESKLKKIILIVGHDKEAILESTKDFKIPILDNNNYQDGMLSSILKIKNNIDKETTGIMISLGDMPLVTSEDINTLIENFIANSGKKICIPSFNNKLGNPMLIPVDTFKRLTIKTNNLLKDKGLKGAILEDGYDIVKVKASRGVLKDFDKAEDFN